MYKPWKSEKLLPFSYIHFGRNVYYCLSLCVQCVYALKPWIAHIKYIKHRLFTVLVSTYSLLSFLNSCLPSISSSSSFFVAKKIVEHIFSKCALAEHIKRRTNPFLFSKEANFRNCSKSKCVYFAKRGKTMVFPWKIVQCTCTLYTQNLRCQWIGENRKRIPYLQRKNQLPMTLQMHFRSFQKKKKQIQAREKTFMWGKNTYKKK